MPFLSRDKKLLVRFQRGEPRALEEVYWAYVDRVESVAQYGFRIASRAIHVEGVPAAELADLVQETFLRAFAEGARKSYDGQRDYAPFLTTIARNLMIDRARKRGREIPLEALGEDWEQLLPPEAPEEAAPWMSEALGAAVKDFVGQLRPDLRGVHEQRFVKCVSQEQAARELGLSRQQLRTLEKRLLEALSDFIDKAGLAI
jgi:RNA polymerase sigma factor (sigma-70 family)